MRAVTNHKTRSFVAQFDGSRPQVPGLALRQPERTTTKNTRGTKVQEWSGNSSNPSGPNAPYRLVAWQLAFERSLLLSPNAFALFVISVVQSARVPMFCDKVAELATGVRLGGTSALSLAIAMKKAWPLFGKTS
jgi:hypothetical protein